MIKKLFLGLFGLYFMDVCNNKTHRNIFDIFWGKESPSFFMFLLIFRMKHHNESNAMAGELTGSIGLPQSRHQFLTLEGDALAESLPLLPACGV